MEQKSIALIGAGQIAQNFHLPVLDALKNTKLVAILDTNKTRAMHLAEKYNVPYVCKDIDELLDIGELDAVDICTPTDTHADLALKCLDRGKSIFVERPLARTYREAEELRDFADKKGLKLMVGMNQRFRSDAIMLKNYIQMGEVGDVFYIKAGWHQRKRDAQWHADLQKSGGGVLMDLGIPLIDSLLWFYDFIPVKSVFASLFHHQKADVEDVFLATLNFENGSVATVEASWSLHRKESKYFCDVFGSEGSAFINPLQLYKENDEVYIPFTTATKKNKFMILRKSFEYELKHFINVICGYAPVISTANEAVKILKIVDAMYRSANERREITIEQEN